MMDLREFLDTLEKAGELHTIAAQVDPKHELGAICKIFNERPNSPALLFENLKGSTIPVVGQLLASDRRVALALGFVAKKSFRRDCPTGDPSDTDASGASGLCQEVVMEGAAVDITKLPICTNNPRDGGPTLQRAT